MIVTQKNEHDRRKHYSACRMLMKLVKAQANHCCQAATQHSCYSRIRNLHGVPRSSNFGDL